MHKTLARAALAGLVGIILTFEAIKITPKPHKESVGAAGLGLTYLAAGYQAFRARKDYY